MTETITVNCAEGLDALPEGTELNLLSDSHYVVKNNRGTFNWSRSAYINGEYAADTNLMTKGSGWLPATVTNPEILGTFFKDNPFKAGDRVVKATVEHFIAQGQEDRDYEEGEAKKGATGTVEGVCDIWGTSHAVNVRWDNGNYSVISPDNLAFEPRLGDTVRVTDGKGCGLEWGESPVGTLVPRSEASLAKDGHDDGFEDHDLAVDVGHFVYLVKAVELVKRAFEPAHVIDLDGDFWVEAEEGKFQLGGRPLAAKRTLDYIEATYGIDAGEQEGEQEDEPTFEVGDRVVIQGEPLKDFAGVEAVVNAKAGVFGTHLTPVAPRPDGYGLSPFYWPTEDLVLVEEVSEPKVGDVVTEDELDALPASTVISINARDSLGQQVYIPRTKVGDGWGWPNKYGCADTQDEMTRAAVREHGATIVHLN